MSAVHHRRTVGRFRIILNAPLRKRSSALTCINLVLRTCALPINARRAERRVYIRVRTANASRI